MTPEEQRIAIANTLGWKDIRKVEEGRPLGKPPGDNHSHPLPDYLRDLNAMHEAIQTLKDPAQQLKFGNLLIEIADAAVENRVDTFHIVNATSAQRAEAFLKTLGLWKD